MRLDTYNPLSSLSREYPVIPILLANLIGEYVATKNMDQEGANFQQNDSCCHCADFYLFQDSTVF